LHLKYTLKNKRYVFCEELDYGDRYSSEIPFNLDYDVYSYEIDQSMKDIVDRIINSATAFVFSELHLKNIQKLKAAYDFDDSIVIDYFKFLYVFQNMISDFGFKMSKEKIRIKFLNANRDANLSDVFNNSAAMCTEFAVLGYLLMKNIGVEASLIASRASWGKRVGYHTLLYIKDFERFWDVGNCFSVMGNYFPSIYDNLSTQENYQNNQMVLRRMPNAGDFSTSLMLDFN
jgi:hypothetical protein